METVAEKNVLINRTQMVQIAREYNIFVSQGTIHRWANERDSPLAVGQKGRCLLYCRRDFISYLTKRLKRIQLDH